MSRQEIFLDPELKWPLFGILIVMIYVGLLRHYLTQLLQSGSKTSGGFKAVREKTYLQRGAQLRANGNHIPLEAFESRRSWLTGAYAAGEFLKEPENRGKPQQNPMADPAGMDQMMDMVKGQMATFIPQTVLMSWINFFFSGFILMKLPFPLTIRFKSMLQSGVATPDLDVRWVSSISWYFLNAFGLKPVHNLILGENAAGDAMAMAGGAMPPQQVMQPGQDINKLFDAEAENLEITQHTFVLDGIEKRMSA
jgi:hypothetical protein